MTQIQISAGGRSPGAGARLRLNQLKTQLLQGPAPQTEITQVPRVDRSKQKHKTRALWSFSRALWLEPTAAAAQAHAHHSALLSFHLEKSIISENNSEFSLFFFFHFITFRNERFPLAFAYFESNKCNFFLDPEVLRTGPGITNNHLNTSRATKCS